MRFIKRNMLFLGVKQVVPLKETTRWFKREKSLFIKHCYSNHYFGFTFHTNKAKNTENKAAPIQNQLI